MAYGKDEAFYAAQGPDHKVNKNRPELDEENALLMQVFTLLHPSRPVHFGGPGPIPLQEIEAFCRLAGFEDAERFDLAMEVRGLDLLYLQIHDRQQQAKRTVRKPKGKA